VVKPVVVEQQDTVFYTGRVEPVKRVDLRARVSGYLQAIRFRDGDWVEAGTPLFDLDPRPFAAVRDRAAANLRLARAKQALAHSEYERDARLRTSEAVSAEDVQQRESDQASADAAVSAAEADLRAAELDLSFSHIGAPMSGRVSDRRVDVGNFVSGGSAQGTLLCTIVTLDPIRVTFEISEADHQQLAGAGVLRPGLKLAVAVGAGATESRVSVLDYSDNEENRNTGTVRLRAELPNPNQVLLPGEFVKVTLPLNSPHRALTVPDAAILADQSRRVVMVVTPDSLVAARAVVLGALSSGQRVVREGLNDSDEVIVGGLARVRPGDRVKIVSSNARLVAR
jgi:multidrug efflux system membrane fusion protein